MKLVLQVAGGVLLAVGVLVGGFAYFVHRGEVVVARAEAARVDAARREECASWVDPRLECYDDQECRKHVADCKSLLTR